jgi:hypothetical protein
VVPDGVGDADDGTVAEGLVEDPVPLHSHGQHTLEQHDTRVLPG